MQISFRHTNPAASHDSTLLEVSPRDKDPYWYLIDAGESVSPNAFIGADDSLDGVFLTHAHSDHYASLGEVLSPEIPLYTSPPTGEIIEQVYTEADRYQNLGNADSIAEALTPIETWTELADGIYVLPIPAGHTAGAAAFLFRIDDLEYNNETVTVLTTGDFTLRSAAGYDGLTVPDLIDIDLLLANAATTPDFPEQLSEAVETILERSLGGATTLVATGALTGIHVAYILGHLSERLNRSLPIHLAGQAAKLYSALNYDIPAVSLHPKFNHTDEVLASGAVTIAGPEAPNEGSTNRLFGVVKDDPDAVFVQLTTSSPEIIDGVACATHHFEVSNHPSEDQFLSFVEDHLPRHLILKHVGSEGAKELGSSFENLFHWGNDDMNAHVLYDDGEWVAPQWLSTSNATRIRQKNYRESDVRMPIDQPIEDLPTVSWERGSATLQTEGVAVDDLQERFESTQPEQPSHQEPTEPNQEMSPTDTPSTEATPEAEPAAESEDSGISTAFQTETVERLEAIELTLDDLTSTSSVEETVETGFDAVETRLDDVETTVEGLSEKLSHDEPETVTATVIRQDELFLLRVDPAQLDEIEEPLDHESEIEIALHATETED
jgi:putative mRNA 3-end processing factor